MNRENSLAQLNLSLLSISHADFSHFCMHSTRNITEASSLPMGAFFGSIWALRASESVERSGACADTKRCDSGGNYPRCRLPEAGQAGVRGAGSTSNTVVASSHPLSLEIRTEQFHSTTALATGDSGNGIRGEGRTTRFAAAGRNRNPSDDGRRVTGGSVKHCHKGRGA